MMINETKQETTSSSPTLSTSGSHTSGGTTLSPTTQNAADYLSQLLKDKKQLQAFPNVFSHVDRLLDDKITGVRANLFQIAGCEKTPLVLPDAEGTVIQKTEKVYVPSKEYPEYNFVGRILGPRGMTAKQLEQETGCKIMVRGRGSMRDKKKEDNNRGKPNWEHLNDELHVLITVEDTENRATVKMNRAIEEVRKLLVPVTEGEDELTKRQLMELAIINGTYRDSTARNGSDLEAATRLMQSPMSHALSGRNLAGASMGTPLIISPARHLMPQQPFSNNSPQAAPPPPLIPADSAAGLLYATAYDAYHHHLATLAAHQHLLGDVAYPTTTSANDGMHVSGKQRRTLTSMRDHPYQRPAGTGNNENQLI